MIVDRGNKKFQFNAKITNEDRHKFAELSGDWNPLHTEEDYAKNTNYKSCILHGAFSAGLLSKMAGMIYPGKSCLLHGMQLKFITPITTPIMVKVIGEVVRDNGTLGEVKCKIQNLSSGVLLVEGVYQFGRHEFKKININKTQIEFNKTENDISIDNVYKETIITGSTGAMGATLLKYLGNKAIPLGYNDLAELNEDEIFKKLNLHKSKFTNIVHCGWPEPNNVKLTNLDDIKISISDQISNPLENIIKLARLIKNNGTKDGSLIIIGSTYANPGSHGWRFPLYSLSKGMLINLTKILAQELAPKGIKVIGLSIDVIDGGMNRSMSPIAKQMNADRTLNGLLPTMEDVVKQIEWILINPGNLISGSFIDLSGGAHP